MGHPQKPKNLCDYDAISVCKPSSNLMLQRRDCSLIISTYFDHAFCGLSRENRFAVEEKITNAFHAKSTNFQDKVLDIPRRRQERSRSLSTSLRKNMWRKVTNQPPPTNPPVMPTSHGGIPERPLPAGSKKHKNLQT